MEIVALLELKAFRMAVPRDVPSPIDLRNIQDALNWTGVHGLRHKRHAANFYRTVRPLAKSSGVLLMCHHFAGEGGMTDSELFMTPDEHETCHEGGRVLDR